MLKQKIKYFIRAVLNIAQPRKCPYCGGDRLKVIDSKFVFTTLLKCDSCGLNHRHPKDSKSRLNKFYQSEYTVDTHLMTTLPSDAEVEKLKKENFPSLRDYKNYIQTLVGDKARIVDYGCSWGYNVFKLRKAGYDAIGYEVSRPRTEFGKKKLEIPIYSETAELPHGNDIILSSHVIEHLADIGEFIKLSKTLLHPNGLFIAFCPNGNLEYRKREPDIWHVNWGDLHPNFLTVEFAQRAFSKNPHLILTGDWEFDLQKIESWDGKSQVADDYRAGKELLIISRPNQEID